MCEIRVYIKCSLKKELRQTDSVIWGHISFSSSNYASLSLSLWEVVNILANVCALIKILTHPNAPCTTPPKNDWLTTSSTPQAELQLNQKAWTKGRFMCSRPSYFSFILSPLLGSHPICKNLIISSSIDFAGTRRQSAAAAPCFALRISLRERQCLNGWLQKLSLDFYCIRRIFSDIFPFSYIFGRIQDAQLGVKYMIHTYIKKILCNIRVHNCRVFKLGKAYNSIEHPLLDCHLLQL